jgi:hypothetical protein
MNMNNHRQLTTKAQRNFNAQTHTFELQGTFSELLFLTFQSAIQIIESTTILYPEKLRQEFLNAFEPYQRTETIIRRLEASRRSIICGLEQGNYGHSYTDLFWALSPKTQALLKQQGINYE